MLAQSTLHQASLTSGEVSCGTDMARSNLKTLFTDPKMRVQYSNIDTTVPQTRHVQVESRSRHGPVTVRHGPVTHPPFPTI